MRMYNEVDSFPGALWEFLVMGKKEELSKGKGGKVESRNTDQKSSVSGLATGRNGRASALAAMVNMPFN